MRRLAIALLTALLVSPANAGSPNGTMNPSWGGYMQTACSPNCASIQATTRLPGVSKASGTAALAVAEFATWIGIGNGPGPSNHLMQSGIIPILGPGNTAYSVFYECYSDLVTFPTMPGTAYAGDLMVYTQSCNANCTAGAAGQTWNFSVQDVTQGWTYTTGASPIACVTGLDTAEVIAEAVTQGNPNIPRAVQFGDVPFTSVKLNGATWTLLTTQEMYAVTSTNDTLNPSDPSVAGDGFKVCYGTGGVYTTCPNTPTLTNDKGRGPGF